jgi:FKBP-type peptidyl-prolyl cis-trans isomerase 2
MKNQCAANGSTVTLHYTIELEDGSKIGSQKPMSMTFTIGGGEVFPVLEEAVVGMSISQVRAVTIKPGQGYGDYNDGLILQVERNVFPDDMVLVPGRTVQYQNRDGQRANFIVQKVDEDRVTLDGNHPLAGHTLVYEMALQKIE